ncbi:hypothetical protein SDC9_83728 [bioreactor metagenome]|uniref:Uncharacterized protein n=1 Tax=bioreactor metagenome TaxID=1076179 RepID=A0A644Z8I1_9ZZZZ
MQQLFPLALHQACHGNAGPPLDDPGDFLLAHLIPQQGAALTRRGGGLLGLQGLFDLGNPAIFQLGGLIQIILPLGLFHFGIQGLQLLPELLHLADGVLFVLPLGLFGLKVLPQLGQLPLDFRQMLPGQRVGLLL